MNKCGGNCNNINDPYAKLCLPEIVKNINVKVFSIKLNKCGGNCNNINDPYAKLCVPEIVKVFNLMQRTKEMRQMIL